jgi:hypothetical protein
VTTVGGVPSSTHPHLFWAATNLRAACRRCNYGAGAALAAANTRRTIEQLRALVEQKQYEIGELREKLAAYENAPATVSGARARDPLAATTARIPRLEPGTPTRCAAISQLGAGSQRTRPWG